MSYNGSGTFVINTAGQPVVSGTVISSTAFNALTADLATGLSTAITKDGQTATTARIPFAAGINSTLVTDSTSTTTGSIITAGGAGVAKALFVGTTANVAGAVTLQSTLGVTGITTFSAQPIFSSLTASSAVATDASKGLVSVTNTGTGNNVLATSPTLVTPALGTPTALVGTNITGTATAFNINGTVGATTATTGAFTTLSASGVTTVQAGSATDPAITTSGDTNTGIFFPAADTVAVSTGGTERARITSGGYFKASDTGTYLGATGLYHELRTSGAGNVYVVNTNASNANGVYVGYSGYSPNGVSNQFLFCEDSTAQRASIRSNGGLANYSANNANLSDRREKTNFAPAKSYLETICAIPVQTFNYIDQNLEEDAGLTLGVVAQDVQAVAPEMVMESNWGTQEDPKMRLSIYQTDLQYALMKCIQEQQALITALTTRITALEAA